MKRALRAGWRRLAAFLVAAFLATEMIPVSAMASDLPANAAGASGSVVVESDGTLRTQGGISASWNAGALTIGPKAAAIAASDGSQAFYWGENAVSDAVIRRQVEDIMERNIDVFAAGMDAGGGAVVMSNAVSRSDAATI